MLFLCLQQIYITYSFTGVTIRAVICGVSCSIFFFSRATLLFNVHCNESLVYFKASDFWYTLNTGLSPKLLLSILLLPQVKEILSLSFCRSNPFTCFSRSQVGEMLRWVNTKPWMLAWVVDGLLVPDPHQDTPIHEGWDQLSLILTTEVSSCVHSTRSNTIFFKLLSFKMFKSNPHSLNSIYSPILSRTIAFNLEWADFQSPLSAACRCIVQDRLLEHVQLINTYNFEEN